MSYFSVPASEGVGGVNNRPQVSQRSCSISWITAPTGGWAFTVMARAGFLRGRSLPRAHCGHVCPAFKLGWEILTRRAPV